MDNVSYPLIQYIDITIDKPASSIVGQEQTEHSHFF